MLKVQLTLSALFFGLCQGFGNLSCFSCSYQNRQFFRLSPCHYDVTNRSDLVQGCAEREHFCKIETVKIGAGSLTKLERSCSTACRANCYYHGLGLVIETCTQCCQTKNCNFQSVFNSAAAAGFPNTKTKPSSWLLLLVITSVVAHHLSLGNH